MLQVNNVNFNRYQTSFKGGSEVQEAYVPNYTKVDYQNDKTQLEEHLDTVNSVIENANVPKTIRAFGKLASVVIGAALGFVSMKYGAQGVAKLAHTGGAKLKAFGEKGFIKRIGTGIKDGAKAVWGFIKKVFNKIKDSRAGQAVGNFFKNNINKFKDTKLYKKVSENKIVKAIAGFVKNAYTFVKTKVLGITKENVENATINLFATAGGVSGAISALSGVAAHNKKISSEEVYD